MPDEMPKTDGGAVSSSEVEQVSVNVQSPAESTPVPTSAPSQDILSILQELQTAFNDKIRFDASREKLIERLHAELQEYKEDLFLKLLKSMALDLITLHDNLGKWSAVADSPTVTLVDVQGDLEDVLDRNGFDAFVVPDETFDPRRQRVLRKVPTTDPALDKRVADRLRKGFSYKDKVIRPECVAVYVLQPMNPT